MDDLGARLKHAREERGVSLSEIAARTKISVVALEALERNDVTRLPGGIFGRAFVRAYALEIGLDPEATVADFQVHLERSEREAAERGATRVEITRDDLEFLERQRRAVRLLRIIVIIVAAAALLLLAWRLRAFWSGTPPRSDTPQAASPVLPDPPPSPAAPAVSEAAPVETPPPSGPPAEQELVVEVGVTANCWIFAMADGVQVVSKLFKPGDSQRIAAKRDVLLDVGNAGAVQWTINGRNAKALGRPGVHVRTTVTKDTVATLVE